MELKMVVKKQKSISIPNELWESTEQLFEKYKQVFDVLEISSSSELLRVMAKLGRATLMDVLEGRKRLSELFEEIGKAHSLTKESPKKQKSSSF